LKLRWFIIWAIALWLVASWTFSSPPQPRPDVDPQTSSSEKYLVEGRNKQRRAVLRALEMPWSLICSENGRKEFTGGLNEYYYHRQNQTERYPETFGKSGATYIAQQWSSADDKRIDRLTQEFYMRGYLKPDDFNAVARKLIIAVVKSERVTGRGCT
jgi:hypothetical protein